MELLYYQDPIGNFGDDLNPWLWPRLIPNFYEVRKEILFLGIGTGLNQSVPASRFKVVFGTGVGYGKLPLIDYGWKFFCVRGPLTANALRLDPKLAITDPAVLIKTIGLPKESKRFDLSFMPHHRSAQWIDWRPYCETANVNYIDPGAGVYEVLSNINRSKVILTEALHGAVVADALRIPWIPVRFLNHILEFKWQDWCQSLGIEYKPVTLNRSFAPNFIKRPVIRLYLNRRIKRGLDLRELIKNIDPILSSDSTLELVTSQLHEKLAMLKAEYFM